MWVVAYKAAYPQLDLSKLLSEDAIDQLSIIEKKCSQDVLDNFESETDTTLIAQPKDVSPWPEILEENSPGSNSINVPLFIQHGDKDEIVPPEISAKMFESYCAKGGTVQRKTYGFLGASHVGVVFVGQLDTLKFVKDRFAGEPYVSDCVIN